MGEHDKPNSSTRSKIGECEYHLCDKKDVEVFRCPFCDKYFCKEHLKAKAPSAAPFRTTDRESMMEWHKKGGHPCPDYVDMQEIKKRVEKEKIKKAFESLSKAPAPSSKIAKPSEKVEQPKQYQKKVYPIDKPRGVRSKRKKYEDKSGVKSYIMKSIIVLLVVVLFFGLWLNYTTVKALDNVNKDVENKITELMNLQDEFDAICNNIENTRRVLSSVYSNLNSTKNSLQKTIEKLQYLKSREKYILHDPTYSEVINFISRDRTDTNRYIEGEYVCSHFARDLNNHAEKQGIRCAYVEIDLKEGGHACVAFNTTDRGLVFFEPQTDERVKLQIGKQYWADCVIPKGNYYYERDPNDVVVNFVLYW